jgi:hypothetical protein
MTDVIQLQQWHRQDYAMHAVTLHVDPDLIQIGSRIDRGIKARGAGFQPACSLNSRVGCVQLLSADAPAVEMAVILSAPLHFPRLFDQVRK